MEGIRQQDVFPLQMAAMYVGGSWRIDNTRKVSGGAFDWGIALIRSSQTFEITFALTGGGPNRESTTLAFFIYENAFIEFNMGYVSTLSYILCVALGLLTLVNFYFRRRWVHE